ncbi:phenylalanine--tRNA ligase subunit beta, partial [Candidatus Parcubacteria bacterium]|nr:phenylalanine--tRNA ligase subunit beta [Candidatus Parcubacteria bacterium]
HFGIAREIAAILNLRLKTIRPTFIEDKTLPLSSFVKFKVKEGCKRYSARVIAGIEIQESPIWLQDRLKACGILPINNVVDVTNYVMLHIGQPLHAFDLEKIEGKEIIVRKAKRGEEIVTLDDEKYELDPDILVIADTKKPLAIAGIKGGKESGVLPGTQLILLESANFLPEVIKIGKRKIDLETDASLRFSHGVDPELTILGLNLAVDLLQKIGKAKIAKGIFDWYPKKVLPKKVKLETSLAEKILGLKIPISKQIKILKRLGFKVKFSPKKLEVLVPTFRLDIERGEDLVEEIGRIDGYHKIKPLPPLVELKTFPRKEDLFWENFAKDVLARLNFNEVFTYSFLSEELIKLSGFEREEVIELLNPAGLEYKFLRPTLLTSLLKVVKNNLPNFPAMKIFEIGKVFRRQKNKVEEKKMLGGLIVGSDFLETKGVVELLLASMGITDYWFDPFQPTPEDSKSIFWHLVKSAEIKIGNEEIGFLGEISKSVLNYLKISKPVFAFEIDFEKLSKIATEEKEYEMPSPYPAILRDISVLVPPHTLVDEVLSTIHQVDREVISDVDLLDIYENPEWDKKSLTFRIVFQSKQKSLSSEEVNLLFEKIIKKIEENPQWEVRK